MHEYVCTLPGGYFDPEGKLHREVALRALGGYEEELITSGLQTPPRQITRLLQRCIQRIGDITTITEEIARDLLVVDREFILLMLRKITFGNVVVAKLACPWPDCLKPIDIDFKIDDVPVSALEDIQPDYACMLYDERLGASREFVFRLPKGRDQEHISHHLDEDESSLLTQLLSHCLLRIERDTQIDAHKVRDLSAAIRANLEIEIEARCPSIDLTMELTCPECSRSFVAPFELQDFFFGEVKTNIELLYREIHYLAFHYHWSEAELMNMPRTRRQRYIDILSSEIEKINDKAH
ncbi:MAG: hypothetical protein GC149_14205 [Gammaproteobacteria bacterium]|nr:hypothetical protein [Gammaproteobacteria bacterium]